jgi:hypothetical protein
MKFAARIAAISRENGIRRLSGVKRISRGKTKLREAVPEIVSAMLPQAVERGGDFTKRAAGRFPAARSGEV